VEQATEDELAAASAEADRTGLFNCPHTGVALAALHKLVRRGEVKRDQRVVVISTAHGLKFTDFKVRYHEGKLPGIDSTLANPPRIQVFATDIDDAACAVARDGVYPETIAADVSAERLERFFERAGGSYRVKKSLRELVLFAPHDLLRHPPFSRVDLVSCRNVLIYLDSTAQQHVLDSLRYALKPGGFLFLGQSESVSSSGSFTALADTHRIFRRSPVAPASVPRLPSSERAAPSRPETPAARASAMNAALHFRILEEYAPPSLIVDQSGQIIHLSERAGRYLRLASGVPSGKLLGRTWRWRAASNWKLERG
jgi:two-component system CheB/CheR fusion protein